MLLYLQEIRSQLENCLSDGSPLLVTDCDIKKLASDSRFIYVVIFTGENCLSDGSPLLVTDCDIKKLASDSRFIYVVIFTGDTMPVRELSVWW